MTITILYRASTRINTNMFCDMKEVKKNISLIKILLINTSQQITVSQRNIYKSKENRKKKKNQKNKKMKQQMFKNRKNNFILNLILSFNAET